MRRLLLLAIALSLAPGCLVLSLNPVYDGDTIGWDPALLGSWQDDDDRSSMDIERGEWKSYRIKYVHTIETGTLTGYLTSIGNDRFLDVMPARGEDRGSFLVPVHAIVRVELDGDRLQVVPLSYDWIKDRMTARTPVAGLAAVFDQKENVLLVPPTAALRSWLRKQPKDGAMFGAPAVFTRSVGKHSSSRP
jgi:hypothetical protein